jgi:viroplasmin and RNaseH domain-containing protein
MKTIYKIEYLNTEDNTRAYDEYFSSLKKAKDSLEFFASARGIDVSFNNISKSIIRVADEKGESLNTYYKDIVAYPGWIQRLELN